MNGWLFCPECGTALSGPSPMTGTIYCGSCELEFEISVGSLLTPVAADAEHAPLIGKEVDNAWKLVAAQSFGISQEIFDVDYCTAVAAAVTSMTSNAGSDSMETEVDGSVPRFTREARLEGKELPSAPPNKRIQPTRYAR